MTRRAEKLVDLPQATGLAAPPQSMHKAGSRRAGSLYTARTIALHRLAAAADCLRAGVTFTTLIAILALSNAALFQTPRLTGCESPARPMRSRFDCTITTSTKRIQRR